VVVSDGSDNASALTLDHVLGNVRAADAAIFTVMLRDPVSNDGNPKLLRRLATETGGEAFSPRQISDVPEALEHIARDIRSAYTIGFAPPAAATDRQLRKLRVTVRAKDGRELEARARAGYLSRVGS